MSHFFSRFLLCEAHGEAARRAEGVVYVFTVFQPNIEHPLRPAGTSPTRVRT
jgi:hypothetical protein